MESMGGVTHFNILPRRLVAGAGGSSRHSIHLSASLFLFSGTGLTNTGKRIETNRSGFP
jgi:hypothetical protein